MLLSELVVKPALEPWILGPYVVGGLPNGPCTWSKVIKNLI